MGRSVIHGTDQQHVERGPVLKVLAQPPRDLVGRVWAELVFDD
ncbi:hypothetical protein AB0K14_33900 [Actinosynnema sp. NPDC050801]